MITNHCVQMSTCSNDVNGQKQDTDQILYDESEKKHLMYVCE